MSTLGVAVARRRRELAYPVAALPAPTCLCGTALMYGTAPLTGVTLESCPHCGWERPLAMRRAPPETSAVRMITLLALLLGLATAGCYTTERVSKTEPGTVESLIYAPAQHGTAIGVTTGGNAAISAVDLAPKWAIVFRCEHGKFIIEGSGTRYRDLWKRLNQGDYVTIYYDEVWRVSNKGRQFVDFDFLDARK